MDKNKVGTMMQSTVKVPISELNEHITCKLCKGYFIDATTIIECLHTFCRSCIVRYLESNKYCPICDVQVHKTKPLLNLRPDKTIQDLVYKLVPRLYQNEIQRRKAFHETHPEGKPSAAEQATESQYDYILAPEESVNLTLHYDGCSTAPRYLRCPSAVLVTHLKKLIRSKYDLSDRHRVDLFYNQECLNPSFSLMDISYIYSWKRKDPLDLTYKIYECRAKKPKLDTTENSEILVNNSTNNNNNNNWKEVQLRISENGEMSITGIEDSGMLELLDATENFKKEIVINEGKNVTNFPKPIQVDTEIGNSEMKIQSDRNVSIDSHVKSSENAPGSNKSQENAQKPAENHLSTPKKELPGLKFIGKSSASSCTTSIVTSTRSSSAGTKVTNGSTRTVNSGIKTVNSASETTVEAKKAPTVSVNTTEASSNVRTSSSSKTSSAKSTKTSADNKLPKNSVSQASQTMSKSVELSASLNLNSELSVIPLAASTSCVSLSSCGGTTTVYSTINKSMCSTKTESSDTHNNKGGQDKNQGPRVNSKGSHTELEKEIMTNDIPKETKNLKRKCKEDGKAPEVPAKLPKPTILNHSIGLMNLSNNHPLKKHSKMNRNGEHLLRTPDISEKVPISTPSLTVNHVSVPQKTIPMDSIPSKPIIINKNVSNMQINRPGTPKSGQRGGHGGNVPCYANKTVYNSVGVGKLGERNGEKVESTQGKTEVLNSAINSISKSSVHHLAHHAHPYQTSHHTPIVTPAQLPHHQNLNSLQVKLPTIQVSTPNPEKNDQKCSQSNATLHSNLVTSQSNIAPSQVNTVTSYVNTPSQSNLTMLQASTATSQSTLTSLKTSIAASHPSVTSQSNVTLMSQKRIDCTQESSQPSSKAPMHITLQSMAANHISHANTITTTLSSMQNTPQFQAPPSTVPLPANHAPAAIKTKPSTPIGYKTLRDPPKSWNSQINSQIARVNQSVKAQQLANAAAAAAQGGGANAQGRFSGDLKSVRPAKFFKGRNMPRYLGCPVSGVKPMYQVQPNSDKDKTPEQQTVQATKPEKSEIKKHSIVKIDPKTLRPISEKAPETSNLSNISSNLAINTSQELRINSTSGDLKINTSSVSIFNPLKLQSSPKSERKSPKSPHSPKVKSNANSAPAVTTSTTTSSPSSSTTLSPKQHRDKTNLTFTPPNPFVPNLTSPTLSPNQFLYPAGGFPSYDPRVMAAYHSLWYSQRMAAAAAAGFVPPPMPHAFGLNIGLNTGTTTIGQQHPAISPKHSTPPKTSGQPSPRGNNSTTSTQIKKSSPTQTPNKKTKESTAKHEKSLETALSKLSQNKAKELSENKLGNNKQQQGGNIKKLGSNKESTSENSMPVNTQRSASPKVLGSNNNLLGDAQQKTPSKVLGGSKKLGGTKELGGETQQSRASPGRISTMSALEKLSHNKAIEILGSDASGKKSPIVRETDGRNSPMAKAVLGESRLVEGNNGNKGSLTSSVTEKTSSLNETTRKPSLPTSESQGSQQTLPENHSDPSTSSQNSKNPAQSHHKTESDKTTSAQISTSALSSEFQTRLEQSSETSNDQNTSNNKDKRVETQESRLDQGEITSGYSQTRSDQDQVRSDQNQTVSDQNPVRSDQDQTKSDQGQIRSDQEESRLTSDQTTSVPSQSESAPSQSVLLKKKQEGDVPECKGEQKDSSNGPRVTSSDKTDKIETNDEQKQSAIDSSDIKPSTSQNSVDVTQNLSAKNALNPGGSCGNVATAKPADNIASESSLSSVVSGDSGAPIGNEVPAVKNTIADEKVGNSENKSVTESDKGGGKKK